MYNVIVNKLRVEKMEDKIMTVYDFKVKAMETIKTSGVGGMNKQNTDDF